MKIINKFFLVIAVCLLCVNISAQNDKPLTFGVKGGINLSNFSGKGAKGLDAKVGFNAGVTVDYRLTSELYLLSGLEFTTKGAKSGEFHYIDNDDLLNSGKIKYNPMYLQLPVHIGYKLPLFKNVNALIHAGPYIAYGIGGKTKLNGVINTELLFTTPDFNPNVDENIDFFGKNAAKRFDYGLGLGVNFEFNKIVVGIGYDFGLANISRNSKNKLKTMNAFLVVGYKF